MKRAILIILAAAMVFALTGCQLLGGLIPDSGDSGNNSTKEPGDVKIDGLAKDKWPSAAFEAFGITEFAAAKDIAVGYYEEDGYIDPASVCALVNCTRSELIDYVNSLLDKGFHTETYSIEGLANRKFESVDLYLPGYGNPYYCRMSYSFDNDGTGMDFFYELDEETYEEVYIRRNLSISITHYYDAPSGWDETITGFEEFGISDSDLRPDCDDIDKRIDGIDCDVFKEQSTGKTATIYFSIDTAFDYYMEEEFYYDYVRKMLKVFESKDTNGELTTSKMTEDWKLVEEKVDVNAQKPALSVYFECNGQNWTIAFGSEITHGASININMARKK